MYWNLFPSPCGEKVGINVSIGKLVKPFGAVFPSPCGEKVGINAIQASQLRELTVWCFRPLAGKR